MKYSYSWLKELSQTKLAPEKIVSNLTMHSFEIESLEKSGQEFDGVVVGEILEISKHPNADKLQIAIVETRHASSVQKLRIVCGAPNIEVGQKVPVATVGTKLPNGLEIKEAEIRGEKSFGMLCAKDELGLGEDHSGILILDKKAKVGASFAKQAGMEDWILEMKVLPDRGHDALSHVGVAREIAILEKRKFDYDFDGLELPKKKSKKLKIEIKDKNLCRRYIGAVMENIEIKESPDWMKARLSASGIRAINNVVDATNYVMMELGQPLHAFDFDKLIVGDKKLAEIVVRRADKDEKMTLLDETEIKLSENDLLITNGKTPLALAGVMGGRDSGIDTHTKTVILEAASFDAVNIRKTRTALNIKTDSSDRFEKDIDPNMAEKAMVRLVEILEHIAGGKLEGVLDVYPKKVNPWKVRLDLEYANRLLGEKIPAKEAMDILNLLGIKTKKGRIIECEIPTYRLDLRTQEDLIEDIGRVWGYENIYPHPIKGEILPAKMNQQAFFERKMQDVLTGLGFDEVYNYSFYGQKDVDACRLGGMKHLELANPMNPDQQFMRVSLVPNLLKNVRDNLRNFKNFNIFESGRVYHSSKDVLLDEKKIIMLAVVLENDKDAETFFAAKGTAEDLLEKIGVVDFSFDAEGVFPELWHPGRRAEIVADGKRIGCVGEISPMVLANYKIGKRVAMAKFEFKDLIENIAGKEFVQLRKYPTVVRDISMRASQKITVAEIVKNIQSVGGKLVLDVELFDIFQKEEKNSFAFHIELGSDDRTLESAEVESLMEKIISNLEKELGVEIRK